MEKAFQIIPREVRGGSIAARMLSGRTPQADLGFSIVKPEQWMTMRAASCVFAAETFPGEIEKAADHAASASDGGPLSFAAFMRLAP